MRILLLSFYILILSTVTGLCQTVTIHHTYYTPTYSIDEHIPKLVSYKLKNDMVDCPELGGTFKADPQIPGTNLKKDYTKGCGYDKGHNMPQKDNSCDPMATKECFYYSNCFPQTPKLNRGVWKALENRERIYAEHSDILVFIGSYGQLGTLGVDAIVIPAYCWKVIYIDKHFEAYIFPNSTMVSGKPDDFRSEDYLQKIEAQTGFNFEHMVQEIDTTSLSQ